MIEKKDIFRKIGGIISELNDQYKFLSESPENLNDLELELFIANSHFLSDHIEILRKLNQSAPASKLVKENVLEKEVEKPQVVEPDNSATESRKSEDVDSSSTNSFEFDMTSAVEKSKPVENNNEEIEDNVPETKESDEVVNGPEDVTKFYLDVEPEEDLPTEPQSVTEKPKVEEQPVKYQESAAQYTEPVKADKPQDEAPKPEPEIIKPVVHEVVIAEKTINLDIPAPASEPQKTEAVIPQTLNERISAQQEAQKTASVLNKQPVADLKSIISLNDKLLFVKDLFNGYSLAYSEAIELVNRYNNFESADNFLKTNYAVKNNWATKQSTVDKFYELLNRRFAK